jgi:hypothetical protein
MFLVDTLEKKRHSFVGGFKFVGTNEYIQIIFVSPETNEYFYIRRFWLGTDEFMGRRPDGAGLPIFIG